MNESTYNVCGARRVERGNEWTPTIFGACEWLLSARLGPVIIQLASLLCSRHSFFNLFY